MPHLTPVSRSAGNHGGPAHSSGEPRARALKTLSNDIVLKILTYVPHAALDLKLVHRQFIVAGRISVSHRAAEMFNSVRSGESELFRALRELEAPHMTRLSLANQIVDEKARLKAEARLWVSVHVSIVRCVRSMGAFYWPDSILTFKELTTESLEVQKDQNPALLGIWPTIRCSFQTKGLKSQEINSAVIPAARIRAWMYGSGGFTGVGFKIHMKATTMLDLQSIGLRCVPREVALFTNLLNLNLSKNELTSLPEDLLQGLTKLERIDLSHNSLTSIPENFFRGLPMLNRIDLENNRLTSLPPALFQGMSCRVSIFLSDNMLAGKTFAGLSSSTTIVLGKQGKAT